MKTNLNIISKEQLDNYDLLRKIDFDKEIDNHKSDNFTINNEKGCLEFISGIALRIEQEDFEVLLGKTEKSEIGFTLIPTFSSNIGIPYKRAMMVVNRKLDFLQIDNVLSDLRMAGGLHLILIFGNKNYLDAIRKVGVLGAEAWSRINGENVSRLSYSYHKNTLTIAGYKGYDNFLHETHEVKSLSDSIQILISKNDYLRFCGKPVYNKADYLFGNDEIYMSVICDIREDSHDEDGNANIKDVVFGNREGHVYLKPISISGNNTRVFMSYSGEPVMQYYSSNEDKWVDIIDSSIVNINNEFIGRLKMKTGDRIYNIMLMQEK